VELNAQEGVDGFQRQRAAYCLIPAYVGAEITRLFLGRIHGYPMCWD